MMLINTTSFYDGSVTRAVCRKAEGGGLADKDGKELGDGETDPNQKHMAPTPQSLPPHDLRVRATIKIVVRHTKLLTSRYIKTASQDLSLTGLREASLFSEVNNFDLPHGLGSCDKQALCLSRGPVLTPRSKRLVFLNRPPIATDKVKLKRVTFAGPVHFKNHGCPHNGVCNKLD
jgi:hypothetical protein